ncbi:MAG: DUF3365 domain-containing protein [Proteobacteria bacterium]|nr:DUF3365 domain-containing protein [Pseudomonadota bacterium]MBU1709598.1 DUF3365 domain-containing protein [Pseudomonadota bacterium]
MSISTRFSITISSLFFAAGIIIILLVNYHMRHQALIEAESKAMIILNHNLAIHSFYSHELKPKLFEFSDPFRPAEYFEPAWMSSTYAIRQITKLFEPISTEEYYYKECAINARSPLNEADAFEKAFISELNSKPELTNQTSIRIIDEVPFFVVLRRGESMEQSCLRCHTTPDQAPADLVKYYGPERSFNRELDEVVSAVSIRIPLDRAYANANKITIQLGAILLGVLFLLYFLIIQINKKQIIKPILRIKDKALKIANKETPLGEEIPLPDGKELQEMTTAFNTMSKELRRNMDQLEGKVAERTKALRQALDKVKTLSGFLPICASCKKIRDDKGYWNQIETYVRDHSEAEFSHSICPDCAQELYPEFYDTMYPKKTDSDT